MSYGKQSINSAASVCRVRRLTCRNSSSVGGKLNRSGVGCAGGRLSNSGLSTNLYLRKKLIDTLFHVDVMYPEVNWMRCRHQSATRTIDAFPKPTTTSVVEINCRAAR